MKWKFKEKVSFYYLGIYHAYMIYSILLMHHFLCNIFHLHLVQYHVQMDDILYWQESCQLENNINTIIFWNISYNLSLKILYLMFKYS